MTYTFCPTCGHKLIDKNIDDEGLIPYCEVCRTPWFPTSATAAIILLMNHKDEVLLLKQSQTSTEYPVLIAGYSKEKERFEDTATREVFEETGLSIKEMVYIDSYVHKNKDLVLAGFFAKTDSDQVIKNHEVDDYKWIDIKEACSMLKQDSIAQKLCKEGFTLWKNKS